MMDGDNGEGREYSGHSRAGSSNIGHSPAGNGHPPLSDAVMDALHSAALHQEPPRPRQVSSPEHYMAPHDSPSPPVPNRFASWQEAVLQRNVEQEAGDRKKIEEWESTQRCWSGTGQKHVESKDLAFSVDGTDPPTRLGAGAYGVVDKVTYNGVLMVRKKIDRQSLKRPQTLDQMREEAAIMEKLKHRHVVTLIGTFTHDNNRFLNILTYPVAVCDLEQYLQDFEQLRGQNYENILDITARVRRLGFADLAAVQYLDAEIRSELLTSMAVRMTSMLGCVTDAMEYVHAANISHQDLKPRNIVLSPATVYITDFGISRVLREPVLSVNNDYTVCYAPPEVNYEEEVHHPSAVDVYSLGSIFLNVVALPPGFPRQRCKDVLRSQSSSREGEIGAIAREIAAVLVHTGADDEARHTISQKHIMGLVRWMLLNDPDARPDMATVNAQLHVLGGLDQSYHAECCKRPNAWMAASLNGRIRGWEEEGERRSEGARWRVEGENRRLRGEVERLRGVIGEGGGGGEERAEGRGEGGEMQGVAGDEQPADSQARDFAGSS